MGPSLVLLCIAKVQYEIDTASVTRLMSLVYAAHVISVQCGKLAQAVLSALVLVVLMSQCSGVISMCIDSNTDDTVSS
jgi:hypothetical protein